MAGTDAIAATSEAIRSLLERSLRDTTDFATVDVTLYQSHNLQNLLADDSPAMVSVMLHRVSVSPARHNVPVRIGPNGERPRKPIPLDLAYLVTAWAGDALMQQRLLGYAIRTLEDTPILPSGLLNDAGFDGTFEAHETIELCWAPLSLADEYEVWQVAQTNQQPSASYIARTVAIESREVSTEHALVQTRQFDLTPHGPPA